MALQGFATDVSMSFKDINVELGTSTTSLLDFQGAAASFSGIRNVETTEGFGALAVELKEFYGKTFSAGSGTYGTRNTHAFRFIDASPDRGFADGQLVSAAENSTTDLGGASLTGQSDFVDDYINEDHVNEIAQAGFHKVDDHINLYADEYRNDTWDEMCKICGVSGEVMEMMIPFAKALVKAKPLKKIFRITYRMEVFVSADNEEDAKSKFENMDLTEEKTEFVELVSVEED